MHFIIPFKIDLYMWKSEILQPPAYVLDSFLITESAVHRNSSEHETFTWVTLYCVFPVRNKHALLVYLMMGNSTKDLYVE